MRSFIQRTIMATLLLVVLPPAGQSHAGLLSPLDASALVQSTASDTDALLLSAFVGFQPGQTLNYNATSTSTTWSGSLSGRYLGTGLSLSYAGDLSGYSSSGNDEVGTGTLMINGTSYANALYYSYRRGPLGNLILSDINGIPTGGPWLSLREKTMFQATKSVIFGHLRSRSLQGSLLVGLGNRWVRA